MKAVYRVTRADLDRPMTDTELRWASFMGCHPDQIQAGIEEQVYRDGIAWLAAQPEVCQFFHDCEVQWQTS